MAIAGRLRPLHLSLPQVLRTASGDYARREGWLLRLEADGEAGWGEAMPLRSFGTEDVAGARQVLEAALPVLREGAAPGSPAEVAAVLVRLPGLAAAPAARHALEGALLDLAARRAGRPVAALLAPEPAASVPVNALLGSQDPDALEREARQAVAEGFQTLKIKVGLAAPEADVRRVAAVRAAVGRGIRIRVDANGGWDEATAIRALTALAPLDLELCEQPVPARDLQRLARVRARVPVPVAADEAVHLDGGRAVLEAGAADLLVLRPMVLGGLLPVLELARAAAAVGVGHVIVGSLDGTVARAGAAHAAAALGAARAAGLSVCLEGDPRPGAYRARAGRLSLPDAPGWGLEDLR